MNLNIDIGDIVQILIAIANFVMAFYVARQAYYTRKAVEVSERSIMEMRIGRLFSPIRYAITILNIMITNLDHRIYYLKKEEFQGPGISISPENFITGYEKFGHDAMIATGDQLLGASILRKLYKKYGINPEEYDGKVSELSRIVSEFIKIIEEDEYCNNCLQKIIAKHGITISSRDLIQLLARGNRDVLIRQHKISNDILEELVVAFRDCVMKNEKAKMLYEKREKLRQELLNETNEIIEKLKHIKEELEKLVADISI